MSFETPGSDCRLHCAIGGGCPVRGQRPRADRIRQRPLGFCYFGPAFSDADCLRLRPPFPAAGASGGFSQRCSISISEGERAASVRTTTNRREAASTRQRTGSDRACFGRLERQALSAQALLIHGLDGAAAGSRVYRSFGNPLPLSVASRFSYSVWRSSLPPLTGDGIAISAITKELSAADRC